MNLKEIQLEVSKIIGGSSLGVKVNTMIQNEIAKESPDVDALREKVSAALYKTSARDKVDALFGKTEPKGSKAQEEGLSIADLRELKKELSEEDFQDMIEGDTRASVNNL